MPRAKVTTTFEKAKPKKKVGRPKGKAAKVTKRPPAEVSDLQEFLLENEGKGKRWVDLHTEFQNDCDHRIWPFDALVATKGDRKWWRCSGCRALIETK